MSYISRALEPVLERAAREFPAVVLTGARQTGKTTLLQHLFGERYRYVSLETPDTVSAAGTDPRGFLQIYAPLVILDEVQNDPHRADRGWLVHLGTHTLPLGGAQRRGIPFR